MPRLLIAGCGDVGSRLGLQQLAQGWTVYGLRRNTAALPPGIHPIQADLKTPQCPPDWPTESLDYVVYSLAAEAQEEEAYRQAYVHNLQRLLDWLAATSNPLRRLIFVSSTGVYAQQDGEWVDEHSPSEPQTVNGQILLQGEQIALHSGHPATAVRLAGLYGPGRDWLIRQAQQGLVAPIEPPLYSNRIHVEDAAGLIATLLQRDWQGVALDNCYLGVDNEPAPLHEVLAWLSQRLGVAPGCGFASRRAGSKRCRNDRAKALGWTPRYAGYQQGYAELLPR